MKKEINITLKDLKATLKDDLTLAIYINDEKVDEIILQKDCVSIGVDFIFCLILGIEDCLSLEEYLSIPEIKALHDEHFKKEVELFGFLGELGRSIAYYITTYGKVSWVGIHEYDNHIKKLKQNYNLFPTEELAEKARTMSLDERKQLLFAYAKGYDVLTRNETFVYDDNKNIAYRQECYPICFYGYKRRIWQVDNDIDNYTYNIYFKEEKHAKECANFLNETKEVSE